jgi:hypothetical protein
VLAVVCAVLGASTLAARPIAAAEVTRVVSALDDDNRFDFNLTLSWLRESKSAFIKREAVVTRTAGNGDTITRNELIKDLQYLQTRNVLNLRADFGILWDVGLHVEAPVVLGDDRRLQFDQSQGADCHYADEIDPITQQAVIPTCVDQRNSTVLRDGILPVNRSTNPPTYGIDGQHPGRTFSGEPTVLRGPTRRGLEYLGLGITWAAFNQARDDTKPTWTLGFDARLDVSKDMRFDPANPGGNTGVGLGYHQLLWSTAVSKRFRYFEPYFGAWYMLPVRTSGSPFQNYGGGQTAVDPQQRGGVYIGVEQIAWEKPSAAQRVTVELRARMDHHFFGRSYSELWEALSGSPQCATDVTKCRSDPSAPGGTVGIDFDAGKASPYPGVTETQAYTTFGGDAGLNIQVGRYARFRGLFGMTLDSPHFITYAVTGADRNNSKTVELNDPNEKNPVYRATIDNPGRRFRVEGTQVWSLLLEGSLMF